MAHHFEYIDFLSDMIGRRHPDIFVDAVSDREGNSSLHDTLEVQLASEYPGKLLNKWDTFIEEDNAFHPLNIGVCPWLEQKVGIRK